MLAKREEEKHSWGGNEWKKPRELMWRCSVGVEGKQTGEEHKNTGGNLEIRK